MQAFLATLPHMYQVNGKTVPPGEFWHCLTKFGVYVIRFEPQTLLSQSLSFYRYHSTSTIQQAGSNIEGEKLKHVLLAKLAFMQRW